MITARSPPCASWSTSRAPSTATAATSRSATRCGRPNPWTAIPRASGSPNRALNCFQTPAASPRTRRRFSSPARPAPARRCWRAPIHRASQRAERPLQAFNCSAVPRDMLESQLFGHRRGAFTGADTASPGVIRAAAGGTLFLDEIAELNLELQPKLLRFLDRQEIHPLGEPHPITVDVRVIAATNADVERLVAEGRFREDLFHRLNVDPPPDSAAARTPRGDSAAGRALPAAGQRRTEERQPVDLRRSAGVPGALQLARQHPPARERGPPHGRVRRPRLDPHTGPPLAGDPRLAAHDRRLRAPSRRSGSASISRYHPRSITWNRRWCGTRWNDRTAGSRKPRGSWASPARDCFSSAAAGDSEKRPDPAQVERARAHGAQDRVTATKRCPRYGIGNSGIGRPDARTRAYSPTWRTSTALSQAPGTACQQP